MTPTKRRHVYQFNDLQGKRQTVCYVSEWVRGTNPENHLVTIGSGKPASRSRDVLQVYPLRALCESVNDPRLSYVGFFEQSST